MVVGPPNGASHPKRGSSVTIRVFLLDDHEVVRRGVRELLEGESRGEIGVAGEAGTAEEALRRLPAGGPGVAIPRVRRVAAGQSLLDPTVTAKVLDRLRRGPEEDQGVEQLTDQERKILDLLAEGLTNRQIGERLYLAEKTVKNYVSNMLMKLGMHRRTEAAVYAARLAERRGQRSD